MDCLLVLVSTEDVYVQKLEVQTRAHQRCRKLTEDKDYLNFLSMKVTQLIDIQPSYGVTSAKCTEFFSKISCSTQIMNLNTELQRRMKEADDAEGLMNYERPLQEIIIQQIKIIDKTLSGLLTGTNINMADETQTQQVIKGNNYSIQTATAFPVGSASYTQPIANNSQFTKTPKQVQKEYPLGNKLWLSNGDPEMTTVYIEEPVQTARVQYAQVPQ